MRSCYSPFVVRELSESAERFAWPALRVWREGSVFFAGRFLLTDDSNSSTRLRAICNFNVRSMARADNAPQRRQKAHVEHAVGLVEHQQFDLAQGLSAK